MAGDTVATGGPDNLIWRHVHDALAFVAARQEIILCPLQAGDILMTGSMTGMIPIRHGDSVSADFNGVVVSATTLVA